MNILVLLCLWVCAAASRQQINDGWTMVIMQASTNFKVLVGKKYNVTLPSTLHLQLLENKQIKEPFSIQNISLLKQLSTCQIKYSRELTIGAEDVNKKHLQLVFEGIDTYANISINGKEVGRTQNAFRKYIINATSYLKVGVNLIEVVIKPSPPPEKSSQIKTEKYQFSAHIRKPAYQNAVPFLSTIGIWKPVYFQSFTDFQLDYVWVRVRSIDENIAILNFAVAFKLATLDQNVIKGKIIVSLNGTSLATLNVAQKYCYLDVKIQKPVLWWPNGVGDSYLYQFQVALLKQNKEIDNKTVLYGIRTVEAKWNENKLTLMVNGYTIYCKGASYVPSDLFYPRLTNPRFKSEKTIEQLLQSAVEANFNYIRIWGGGQYESQQFLTLASKLGIMVFVDFMFSGSIYPSYESFLRNVEFEVKDAVRMARNYPCITLWIANDDIKLKIDKQIWGSKQVQFDFKRLFEVLLPKIMSFQSPNTPYVKELSYSGLEVEGFPVYETTNYILQGNTIDLKKESDLKYQTHKNQFSKIAGYLQQNAQLKNFQHLVYASGLYQAQTMETFIKNQRVSKQICSGILFGQFNDYWSTISSSSLDYFGRWKPLLYTVKKLYANIVIFVVTNRVYIANDKIYDVKVKWFLQIIKFDGTILFSTFKEIIIPAKSAFEIFEILPEHYKDNKNNSVIYTQIVAGKREMMWNTQFLVPLKQLVLPKDAKLKIRYDEEFNTITLSSTKFLKYVQIYRQKQYIKFSDNYFDLVPGHPVTVFLDPLIKLAQIKGSLKYRSYVQIHFEDPLLIEFS